MPETPDAHETSWTTDTKARKARIFKGLARLRGLKPTEFRAVKTIHLMKWLQYGGNTVRERMWLVGIFHYLAVVVEGRNPTPVDSE